MAKEIQAWGARRKKVDMDKLALAYYLLAKAIIEEDKRATTKPIAAKTEADKQHKEAA